MRFFNVLHVKCISLIPKKNLRILDYKTKHPSWIKKIFGNSSEEVIVKCNLFRTKAGTLEEALNKYIQILCNELNIKESNVTYEIYENRIELFVINCITFTFRDDSIVEKYFNSYNEAWDFYYKFIRGKNFFKID